MYKIMTVVLLSAIFLPGCAAPTIHAKVSLLNEEGGQTLVISSSTTEAIAYDGAKVRAEEHCFNKGLDFVVVKEESVYQGVDKNGTNEAISMFTGSRTKSLDDYKVKMTIKCEGAYSGKGAPFPETLDLSTTGDGGRGFGGGGGFRRRY